MLLETLTNVKLYETLIYIAFSAIIILLGSIVSLVVYVWNEKRQSHDYRIERLEKKVREIYDMIYKMRYEKRN